MTLMTIVLLEVAWKRNCLYALTCFFFLLNIGLIVLMFSEIKSSLYVIITIGVHLNLSSKLALKSRL
jgi:hypothetical protein